MDKSLIRSRFARAATTYSDEAVVQARIARRMTDIMLGTDFPRNGAQVLEFGCGSGGFTALWTLAFRPAQLWLNDLCPEVLPAAQQATQMMSKPSEEFHEKTTHNNTKNYNEISDRSKLEETGTNIHLVPGDIEQLPLPEALDAVVSCSALQWLEHPETFLHRCAASLRPGGYLVFSTFGPQNVHEVMQLTGATLPYRSASAWAALLETDFEVVHRSEELHRLTFPDPVSVLHHLKATGVTGIRKERWNKTTLRTFAESYRNRFATKPDGVQLTYHPVYLVARKR